MYPGNFRVSNWEPDFNPYTQIPIKVQVWIRLFISVEYWHPHNLKEIAKAVGHPIRIDWATITKTNGRILVELNYNHTLTTDIQIQRASYKFWLKIFYERLPNLCDCCQSIGHTLDACKKNEESVADIQQSGPSGQINIVLFLTRNFKNKRRAFANHQTQEEQKEMATQSLSANNEDEAFQQTLPGRDKEARVAPVTPVASSDAKEGVTSSVPVVVDVSPQAAPANCPSVPSIEFSKSIIHCCRFCFFVGIFTTCIFFRFRFHCSS